MPPKVKSAAHKSAATPSRKPNSRAPKKVQAVIPENEYIEENEYPEITQVIQSHLDKVRTEKNIKSSFKSAIKKDIIAHEMLTTKSRVEMQLETGGDLYYVTQEQAEKMDAETKKVIKNLVIDALILGASCFIVGVFMGRRQVIKEMMQYNAE